MFDIVHQVEEVTEIIFLIFFHGNLIFNHVYEHN